MFQYTSVQSLPGLPVDAMIRATIKSATLYSHQWTQRSGARPSRTAAILALSWDN